MKLLFLITFLFCINVVADNLWLSESDFADRKAGNRGHTLFVQKAQCELIKAPDKCVQPSDIRRQKMGPGNTLMPDPAGIAAADEEDAQKGLDIELRETKKAERDLGLDQCVQDSKAATLTLPQASSCIRALVRELQGDKVDPADL